MIKEIEKGKEWHILDGEKDRKRFFLPYELAMNCLAAGDMFFISYIFNCGPAQSAHDTSSLKRRKVYYGTEKLMHWFESVISKATTKVI